MSEFKDVLTSSPNPLPSHSSLFSFQNSPKNAALRKKVWVIGGIAVVVTTIAAESLYLNSFHKKLCQMRYAHLPVAYHLPSLAACLQQAS